jgi:RND family efflux transporter MFP subunit
MVFKKIFGFLKTKRGMAVVAVVLIGIIWFAMTRPHATAYQLSTVQRGTLTEVVSVTGNVTSTKSVMLAFENGGTIAAIYDKEGDHVNAGGVIAKLDTRDLEAQLAEAQANVDAETAALEKLQAGPTSQNIAVSQTALAAAEQTLANSYLNIPNALTSAYASANDAVRNQLASFFANAETNGPQLTFPVNDSQIANNLTFERLKASTELNAWQAEDQKIVPAMPSSTLDALLQNTLAHLAVTKTLLTTASNAVVNTTNVDSATTATYKTDVTNGLNEVNTSIGNVNALAQSIASEKAAVAQAKAQLDLTLAGATQEDIDAQTAQVEQAKANAETIQVKIDKASLVAPFGGIITMQTAKVGEIASPGIPVVSLLADRGLEIDANIAEVDIGKVIGGDVASVTLDAFQGKTFSGKVTYVSSGETLIEGVPTYKTVFQFDNLDPGVKTGMTANIDITTAVHTNVLYVPQRTVTTNADGTRTVEVYHGAKQPLEKRTVTVGIRDVNGNIEIASGLNEGDVVARAAE